MEMGARLLGPAVVERIGRRAIHRGTLPSVCNLTAAIAQPRAVAPWLDCRRVPVGAGRAGEDCDCCGIVRTNLRRSHAVLIEAGADEGTRTPNHLFTRDQLPVDRRRPERAAASSARSPEASDVTSCLWFMPKSMP